MNHSSKNELVKNRVNFWKLTQIYSNFSILRFDLLSCWIDLYVALQNFWKQERKRFWATHIFLLFDFESLVWLCTLVFKSSHTCGEVFSWWYLLCFRKLVSKSWFPTLSICTNALENQSTLYRSRLKIFTKVSGENDS